MTQADTIARELKKKPAVIFRMGDRRTPHLRRAGYTSKSIIGMTMMIKMGFSLETMSLGTLPSTMVLACETKLLVIWLYASQYRGYHKKTLHATTPRFTSSTHSSSNVIQLGMGSPRARSSLGLTRCQNSGSRNPLLFFMAKRTSFHALTMTEPVGGDSL